MLDLFSAANLLTRVAYLDTTEWRRLVQLRLSEKDKENNKLAKKKKKGHTKITTKHLSVRLANETFGLKLLKKQNDEADAICLALAFFNKKGM